MVKCIFCGKDKGEHQGIHLLKNDGSVNYYCGSKCRKNDTNLKRDKRKVRWAEAFHERREKARAKIAAAKAIAEAVTLPIIASGGAGTLEHLYEAITEAKADAVLVASIAHFGTFTIQQMKE